MHLVLVVAVQVHVFGGDAQLVDHLADGPQVGGLGDFNGDGLADIFWRNTGTGGNLIWLSGNAATAQVATTVGDPNWKVALVGDFNGDALADVFWRNVVTGNYELWRSGLSSQRSALARVADIRWAAVP